MSDTAGLSWRKSSYSGANGGNCVEVVGQDGTIMVRDTTDHGNGPVHRFTPADWRTFVTSVKAAARLSTARRRQGTRVVIHTRSLSPNRP